MGGGKVTPVESDGSDQNRETETSPAESGYLLSAYPVGGDQDAIAQGGDAELGKKGSKHPLEPHGAASVKKVGDDGQDVQEQMSRNESGDVTINFAGKGQKNQAQMLPKDDDDNEELKDVQPSGESVFDMLGTDNPARYLPFWKQNLLAFVDGVWASVIMTLLTVVVLFMDDMRLACFPPSVDEPIVVVTIICLVFFGVELIINSLAKPDYFLGFYFWLDLVATLSLLGDIPDFMELITGQGQDGAGGVDDSTTLARAGRTSRAGTRAGRIARVMRLIRLIRLVKLYRHFESNKEKKDRDLLSETDLKNTEDEEEVEQSRVGQKLSDLTTRRVIIGVLGMLFILPLFEIDAGYYGEESPFDDGGLQMVHEVALASGLGSDAYDAALQIFEQNIPYQLGQKTTSKLLSLSVLNIVVQPNPGFERRSSEISLGQFKTDECDLHDMDHPMCYVTKAVYDMKWHSQLNAILNIARTFFIIIVLGVGALLFSRDANLLVLRPLEKMIQMVKDVSENPLARQAIAQDVNKEDAKLETRVLENSIMKICTLLAVGFGDAGAEVIAENMKKAGALNPMVPGRKMVAIFGFCDIRQFTDTTEVLQEEVMEFVNSIAHIVHTEVALHGGAANKNIGDAFLLVWKFPRGTRLRDIRLCTGSEDGIEIARKTTSESEVPQSPPLQSQGSIPLSTNNSTNLSFSSLAFSRMSPDEKRHAIHATADNALASFIIIHAALKRSAQIKKYTVRQDLNSRMPNFEVRMGFGLHVGWAIEGAIGSEYKVDASYLSPNVNMASRLEAATKQFGSTLLMSGDFVRCLSPWVRSRVRQIDSVTVKGSNQPMGLFAYDVCVEGVPNAVLPEPGEPLEDYATYSRDEHADEWGEHPDLAVSWALDEDFRAYFGEGFDAYLQGEWGDAKRILTECLTKRRNGAGEVVHDGPSKTLLDYMGGWDYTAPPDWKGFRELTEK